MSSRLYSVSVPEELANILDENPNLSPSKMLQTQICIMKDFIKDDKSEKITQLIKAKNIIQEQLLKMTDFLVEFGFWDKFCDWEKGK